MVPHREGETGTSKEDTRTSKDCKNHTKYILQVTPGTFKTAMYYHIQKALISVGYKC